MTAMVTRLALGFLCAVRVAVPLAALVASPGSVPGLPYYRYEPTPGDGQGFYSAAREFIASWGRLGPALILLLGLALVGVAVAGWRLWRSRPARRAWVLAGAGLAVGLVLAAAISQMSGHTGAAVVGWSLVWGAVMLPVRAVGVAVGPDTGFAFGLALSLAANCVTVVATWAIGLRATGRRPVAFLAAGVFAFWPLLAGLVSGERGWTNGTWNVDAGLHMYTEPLSTALVAVAVVLLLAERPGPVSLAAAGLLLSFSTAVRLSNGLFLAVAVLLAAVRLGPRRAAPLAAAGAAFVPVVIAWWPKGYSQLFDDPYVWPPHPFAVSYAGSNWTDSLFFSPRAYLVLLPLAVAGALFLRTRCSLAVLGSLILVNALFYSFYANTAEHPRFLFVAFPALFVLWAAGAAGLVGLARRSPGIGFSRLRSTSHG
jgi:hypothetical protein